MPRGSKSPSSSMFPNLHNDVVGLLESSNLVFSFHNIDQPDCIQSYDTNIMGRFSCRNDNCLTKGWSSKIIAITIRQYTGNRYNVKVYHQRCKACNWLAKPNLDNSYAERVAYRLKRWSGVTVETPPFKARNVDRPPHIKILCEGCRAGHCKMGYDD